MRFVLRLSLLVALLALVNGCGTPTSPIITKTPDVKPSKLSPDKVADPRNIPPPPNN